MIFARLALLALAALLAWRIVAVNAVSYAESNRPVVRVPAEGPQRKAALQAELAANPASPEALVAFGAELERSGDVAGAARAFSRALEVAPIDATALRAAADLDARQGRFGAAVRHIDRLLTFHGPASQALFPVLNGWLPIPEARGALEKLARNPSPWIGAFVLHACTRAEPRLAASILSQRLAAGLAAREEVRCGIEALGKAGQWELAYQLWLNSLPRERLADVGFVFNGGFEFEPTGMAFDWAIDERSGAHRVDFVADPGAEGRRALLVAWTGKRIGVPALHQHLAAPPGRYELSGLARLDGLQSVRGIRWAVRCASGQRTSLGESSRLMGSGPWERFAFSVVVPEGCTGQLLQLEPVGLNEGTTYVAGRAWFDQLRLARSN